MGFRKGNLGSKGREFSEETRQRMRIAATARQADRKYREELRFKELLRLGAADKGFENMTGQEIASAHEAWEPTKLPKQPTQTLCGTQERAEVYRKRLEDREQLYHPNDTPAGVKREIEPNHESFVPAFAGSRRGNGVVVMQSRTA